MKPRHHVNFALSILVEFSKMKLEMPNRLFMRERVTPHKFRLTHKIISLLCVIISKNLLWKLKNLKWYCATCYFAFLILCSVVNNLEKNFSLIFRALMTSTCVRIRLPTLKSKFKIKVFCFCYLYNTTLKIKLPHFYLLIALLL